jgi:hypothetical protein
MTQAAILAASGSPGTTTGFKNRIINGNMVISQRNGTTSTSATDSTYNLDRWKIRCGTNSKFTTQQVTTAPAGFSYSTLITSSANTSLGVSDYYFIAQLIEGFNSADLGFGTANAKTIAISFWVQSSITGSFGGAVQNGNGTRSYPFGYTISAANTWQQVTVTIPGDTSGTWTGASTSVGLELRLNIASGSNLLGTANVWASADYQGPSGSTNLLATNGNTMNITGVQLEVGTTATNFDFRSYGTELSLCQRYLPAWTAPGGADAAFAAGGCANTTVAAFTVIYPVPARVPATGVTVTNSSYFSVWFGTSGATASSITFAGRSSANACQINLTTTGLTAGYAAQLGFNTSASSTSVLYLTGCEL